MTKPDLHEAVDLAWPTLKKIVSDTLGDAKHRAYSKLVNIHRVPDSSRVVVTDVKSVPHETDLLTEHTYTGTPVYLSHRRHKLSITEDDLRFLPTNKSEGIDVRNAITGWAKGVLAQETKRLTTPLKAAAVVLDAVNQASVRAARLTLWPPHGSPTTPATLLVTRNGLNDPAEIKGVRRALAGGLIIDLPMTDSDLESTALLVDPKALRAVLLVAIELKLGWNPVNGKAVIHLDHRTSTPADPPAMSISPTPVSQAPPPPGAE